MPEPLSLDAKVIDKLHQLGGASFVQKMILLFHKNASQKIEEVRQGVDQQNRALVERAAHSLISSAGNVGALKLMELARRFEETAARNETTDWPALFSRLQQAYDEAKSELIQLGLGKIE